MSNLTRNQDGNVFVLGQIAQAVGDYFRLIKRYDEAREEYFEANTAYDLVHRSSPDFVDAQNHKEIVRNILQELSVPPPVPVVAPPGPVKLSDWLRKKFYQAIETGWQTLEDIFGPKARTQPAFRSHTVERAKQINLGTEAVAFVLKLNELQNQEIRVLIGVFPIGEQTHLPKNLKVKVIPESGEPDEHLAESHPTGFETEWFYEHGEKFSVEMQLDDVKVTEDFVI